MPDALKTPTEATLTPLKSYPCGAVTLKLIPNSSNVTFPKGLGLFAVRDCGPPRKLKLKPFVAGVKYKSLAVQPPPKLETPVKVNSSDPISQDVPTIVEKLPAPQTESASTGLAQEANPNKTITSKGIRRIPTSFTALCGASVGHLEAFNQQFAHQNRNVCKITETPSTAPL